MKGISRITLIGNLGKDPEHRLTPAGKAVVTFSLAVNKGKGKDDKDLTNWYTIHVWNEKIRDAVLTYLKKGSPVYIDGDLLFRTYQKENGTDGYSLDVNASQVQFLNSKPAEQGEEVPF